MIAYGTSGNTGVQEALEESSSAYSSQEPGNVRLKNWHTELAKWWLGYLLD